MRISEQLVIKQIVRWIKVCSFLVVGSVRVKFAESRVGR